MMRMTSLARFNYKFLGYFLEHKYYRIYESKSKATGEIVNVELKDFGSFTAYVSDKGVMYNGLYELDFDIDVDMKARVKKTGEIVELADDCYLNDKDYEHSYYADELESIEFDYWEKLKHQYAGMAMQGMLTNEKMMLDLHRAFGKDESMDITISEFAIDIANTLVKKLKNE